MSEISKILPKSILLGENLSSTSAAQQFLRLSRVLDVFESSLHLISSIESWASGMQKMS